MATRQSRKRSKRTKFGAYALDCDGEIETKFQTNEQNFLLHKINDIIGFGVFAKSDFEKGEFLLEYRGERITEKEADHRVKNYKIENKGNFIYYGIKDIFGKWICFDATNVSGYGRMVNDSPSHFGNATMKRVVLQNEIYLCLHAIKKIPKGTEIRYDYGEDQNSLVWRKFEMYLYPYFVTETKEGWKLLDQKTSSNPTSEEDFLGKKEDVRASANSFVDFEVELPAVHAITTADSKHRFDPTSVQVLDEVDNSPVNVEADVMAVHAITTSDSKHMSKTSNVTMVHGDTENELIFDSDSESDNDEPRCKNWDALLKKISKDSLDHRDKVTKTIGRSEIYETYIPGNVSPIYTNTPSLENIFPVCSSPVPTRNDDIHFGASRNSSFDQEDPLQLTIPENDSGIAVEKSLEIINSDNEISTIDTIDNYARNGGEEKPTVKGKSVKPARPCIFCNRLQTKLKRHILSKHKQHELVLPLLTMNAKEQDRIIDTFRKDGIKKHNLELAEKGEETFMRERKTKSDELPLMCSGCKGFFAKSYKARHQLVCPANGSNFMIPVVSIQLSAVADEYSDSFKALLNTLQLDEVGTYIKMDKIILMMGSRSFAAVQRKIDKKTEAKKSVRARMRLIARLYFEFRKLYGQQNKITLESKMGNAGDMYRRESITILGEAVMSMCEKPHDYIEEGNVTNLKSGLMISILNMLKLTSKFLIGHFLVQNADDKSKGVVDFLEVLRLYEHDYFDAAYYEINHRRNTSLRKPASIPKDSDVQALTQECDKIMSSIDVYDFNAKTFISVRSAVATTLIIFNARRGGEPVRLLIKQWEEALRGEWVEKVNQEEDFNEETMLVTYQTGKGANHLVPVMFPPECLCAMKYLVDPEMRKQAGIRTSNCYIFATTQSDSHASGWHCINEMLKRLSLSGAVNAITNRHRVASMLAKLDLSSKEKELIYQHFGHSGSINQNVYQAAAGTIQLETTGKRLIQIQNRENVNGSSENLSVERKKTPIQDRECLVQETAKKRKLHQNNSSEKENSPNVTSNPLANKRKYPKRKRPSKVSPSDGISSSDEEDTAFEPSTTECSDDENDVQDEITRNSKPSRPYTIWSNNSKEAFQKEFGEFIKRDFGYPSRQAIEAFAKTHSLLYQQIRTRIVNERRLRQKKTKTLKQRIEII